MLNVEVMQTVVLSVSFTSELMLSSHHLSVGGKKTGKEIKKVCHLLNVIPKIGVFFFLPEQLGDVLTAPHRG